MRSITLKAHAKINLTLDVLNLRPDGFHEIRSLMHTIALHDLVDIRLMPEKPGITLNVNGEQAHGVPNNQANLVHQAAVRLQKTAVARGVLPASKSGLEITLTKSIPSQAGLGGGSSDAAATLRAVNQLFDLQLSADRLTEIGVQIGADIPFFLTGGRAQVAGLGEQVMPLPSLSPPWFLVIVKPAVGVSTGWAYNALDALPARAAGAATEKWDQTHKLSNDFEAVVLPRFTEIAHAHAFLASAPEIMAEMPPLLCGSGSALFCRVRNEQEAAHLAKRVKAIGIGDAWATQTVSGHT